MVEGAPLEITGEAQDGLIVDQSPEPGEWIAPGTAVTVSIGVYVPPDPPEEDPPPEDG
jgi:beta-lactam-binding protein with PASTA domain